MFAYQLDSKLTCGCVFNRATRKQNVNQNLTLRCRGSFGLPLAHKRVRPTTFPSLGAKIASYLLTFKTPLNQQKKNNNNNNNQTNKLTNTKQNKNKQTNKKQKQTKQNKKQRKEIKNIYRFKMAAHILFSYFHENGHGKTTFSKVF